MKLADDERIAVSTELGALVQQAEQARTEADLLRLADAVHCLVEETPTLRRLLLPPGLDVRAAQETREVGLASHLATAYEDLHAHRRAQELVNDLVNLRDLFAPPQPPTEPGRTGDRPAADADA